MITLLRIGYPDPDPDPVICFLCVSSAEFENIPIHHLKHTLHRHLIHNVPVNLDLADFEAPHFKIANPNPDPDPVILFCFFCRVRKHSNPPP
jgi:hypothetical protein